MANVFVYGSLLAEEVLEILIKRVPASRSAILHGFRRYGLRDRVYPAIVPSRDSSVQGKVLLDLTQPELDRLDDFEGEEYEKRAVEPAVFKLSHSDAAQQIDAGAETPITALVYVWSNPDDPDLVGHWDYEVDILGWFFCRLTNPLDNIAMATFSSRPVLARLPGIHAIRLVATCSRESLLLSSSQSITFIFVLSSQARAVVQTTMNTEPNKTNVVQEYKSR